MKGSTSLLSSTFFWRICRIVKRIFTEHPEKQCARCKRPNVESWYAPSPLWNAVLRDPITLRDLYGILCPTCFAELAAKKDDLFKHVSWRFAPDGLNIPSLWTDRDGRVWDTSKWLWVEPMNNIKSPRGME